MSVFSVERHGFISLYSLVSSIGQDLKDHGFHAVLDTVTGNTVDAVGTGNVTSGATPTLSVVSRLSPTYGFKVSSVTVTDAGTKYDPDAPPTVTFSAPAATGSQIMLDSGYSQSSSSYGDGNYWDDPDISGTNNVALTAAQLASLSRRATGTAIVGTDGTITGVTITDGGFGYAQGETITVTFTGGHVTKTKLLLESTTLVDPLGLKLNSSGQPLASAQQAGTQPWRVNFELRGAAINAANTGGSLGVYLGTASTLRDNGIIGYVVDSITTTSPQKVEPAGNIGAEWTGSGAPESSSLDQCFLNRVGRSDASIAAAYPMSYRLTVTNRGIFLGVWEANAEELGRGFNWLVVQRSVDRLTGVTRGSTVDTVSGRCPVFCLNAVNNKYYKFVVREADLLIPSERKFANSNVEDSSSVINTLNQQSLTENGEYVVTFISNLNTARYKYTDELDMIGTVSADVVGCGTEISVTVYGEAQPRTYRALYPNGAFGTGMRLMVLVANPNET